MGGALHRRSAALVAVLGLLVAGCGGTDRPAADGQGRVVEVSAHMDHHHANAIVIEPGETESLTWTFSEAGEVLYACHEPGHYDAGMVGTVTVR